MRLIELTMVVASLFGAAFDLLLGILSRCLLLGGIWLPAAPGSESRIVPTAIMCADSAHLRAAYLRCSPPAAVGLRTSGLCPVPANAIDLAVGGSAGVRRDRK